MLAFNYFTIFTIEIICLEKVKHLFLLPSEIPTLLAVFMNTAEKKFRLLEEIISLSQEEAISTNNPFLILKRKC